MARINLHGDLQDVEGPNRSGRASVFDSHLPLDLTAHTTEPSVIGAFVRATLADYRESKKHSDECKHSRATQSPS
jgi:hypothetical protein